VRVTVRVRVRVRARARRQVAIAGDDDLARVRLRLQPGTEGLELLRPPRVREIARVDQTVARRKRPAWRRAVRVAHAHEAHGSGRLRPGLLQSFQRQCSRLLPRAEHLLVQAGACSAARAEAATAVGRAVEREEVQEVNGLRLPSTRASARVCGCWLASASARATSPRPPLAHAPDPLGLGSPAPGSTRRAGRRAPAVRRCQKARPSRRRAQAAGGLPRRSTSRTLRSRKASAMR